MQQQKDKMCKWLWQLTVRQNVGVEKIVEENTNESRQKKEMSEYE